MPTYKIHLSAAAWKKVTFELDAEDDDAAWTAADVLARTTSFTDKLDWAESDWEIPAVDEIEEQQ